MFKIIEKIRAAWGRMIEAQKRKGLELEAQRKEYDARLQHARAMRVAQNVARQNELVQNGEAWRLDKKEWERIVNQPFDAAVWQERKRLKKERKQREWEERAIAHYEKTGKVLEQTGYKLETANHITDPKHCIFVQNLCYREDDD